MSGERATAFVPGHITGFFSAHPAEKPAAAGSRGAGFTLTDGVEVSIVGDGEHGTDDNGESADRPTHTLDGETTAIGAVDDVLDRLGVPETAHVAVESELPVGAGFGVSGAAALGTALATNDAFDCGRSENDLIRIAHEAEVSRGTGLGDVVAQARGGIPIRVQPGAPGYGELDGIPARTRIEYVSFGELSTEEVLAGDTTALSDAGEWALTRLQRDPRLPTLMGVSREFAGRAGLLVPEVSEAIAAVEDAGGAASMAMLGRTVFATGTGLSDAGYDATACHTHAAGAGLVREE
ncbi:pantoate kinase [Halorubrum gandharaense]